MKARKLPLKKFIKAPWVMPIVALASVVRFFDLAKSAIWHDEGFTMMLSGRTPSQIWAGSARDVHPPLYYEMLHAWQRLFGTSVFNVRLMSAIAGVIVVLLGVWLVRIISTRRAAIIAGVLLSLMPIMVRYSQEARMYGVLGMFLLGATIAVVYWLENPSKNRYLVYYSVLMAAGFYTHYFTALAIVAIWLYLAFLWRKKKKLFDQYVLQPKWLIANVGIIVLFGPWLPNLVSQFTRGQGVSWIPKATLYTLPSSFWQFMTFTDGRRLFLGAYVLLPLLFLAATIFAIKKDHTERKYTLLLALYCYVPIMLTFLVSFKKPLYIDRYLVFAAAAVPMIVAIAIDRLWRVKKAIAITTLVFVVTLEIIGLRNVYAQANHKMNEIAAIVNNSAQPGDVIISGELYTYFDFSYYNNTGILPLLYTPTNADGTVNHPNGYGESGLLYDRANEIYLDSYRDIPAGKTVWLVGKTGDHDYYNQVPYYWQLISTVESGYSEVRIYHL